MIGALTQNFGQFRTGKYLGKRKGNAKNAPFFEYELVKSEEAKYNQIIQNLISSEKSVVIKSTWRLDWCSQSFVKLQDNQIYIINNWQGIEDEINPQNAALVVDGLNTTYYLELIGAEED